MYTGDPNWFAYVALLLWPFVTIVLFRFLSPVEALLWTVLGAQMFLPERTELKVEMLPQIDKNSIASVCALIGCMTSAFRPEANARFGLVGILLGMLFLGPVITSYFNGDVTIVGAHALPGVGVYDGASAAISQFFFVLPFFLGRRYVGGEAGAEKILRVLAIAGLIYSVLMLFEIRMSPQLHRWIYGFFPSDFITESRSGGYRPVVFMGLGLIAAFFTATCAIASAALWRAGISVARLSGGVSSAYLSVVLLLCKSWGALIYGIILIPMVLLARPRLLAIAAVFISSIALTYPILRYSDLFPTQALVELVKDFSADRAFSLQTRFKNEDQLLGRASERFLFGWGRYGRNRIYADYDGRNASLTDGQWIITLGTWGIIGFVAQFGLLSLVVFRAAFACKLARAREQVCLVTVVLILALTLLEQLPNASIRPWTWLVTGALLGRSEMLRRRVSTTNRAANAEVGSKLSVTS